MPITPLHWSILILGLILFNYLYIPALFISCVLMDIEPFYYLFIAQSFPLHRFFHTFLGASFLALIIGFVLIKIRKTLDKKLSFFQLNQAKLSNKSIYLSAFIGAYSHIILDSFMHRDIKPFWPFTSSNPLLNIISTASIYRVTEIGLLITALSYIFFIIYKSNK